VLDRVAARPPCLPATMSDKSLRAALLALLAALFPAPAAAAEPPTRDRAYRLESGMSGSEDLRQRFNPRQLELLEKLNRADAAHLGRLPVLVIPEVWIGDELQYSPLPLTYAGAGGHPKALVVHQPSQVFGAYEHGRLVRWGPVSSGREKHPTPSGLFHLSWKSPGRHSTVDPDWYMPWYFNFHNERGLAFHQLTLPGLPASHACIRLLERDAKWLYEWGEGWVLDERGWNVLEPGTPVLILGQYGFGAPPPWRSPDWLATGADLPGEAPPRVLNERRVDAEP
jgi:hypothetical protein